MDDSIDGGTGEVRTEDDRARAEGHRAPDEPGHPQEQLERAQEELEHVRDELEATSEILAILGSTNVAPEDVFGAIVERARALCRADIAQIHLYEGGVYRLTRGVGLTPEYVELSSSSPIARNRASLIGRISLDRTTQQIVDVLADPEYDRPIFQRLGGYRTIMGAPMLVDGEVLGVLSVWRNTVSPFDERTAALLTTFAIQGALAIRNVTLRRSLEARTAELAQRVGQLEALAEVGEVVSSSLDVTTVLATIVNLAVSLTGTDGGSLLDYDDETGLFRVRVATGTSPDVIDELDRSRIHIDETMVGRACRERHPVQNPNLARAGVSEDSLDVHLRVLRRAGWRSVVAVPLVRSDEVVGALVVRRRRSGAFSALTCELLEAFASQSAIALTNARVYEQLEHQSRELAEASRHKSEFLASMSHELRTPLNAVIGFSEVLLERLFGELNERQDDYLRDIRDSGRHLLALLNDILDLSKVEAGQMELERTDVSAPDVIAYSLAMVRERASNHRIALRTQIDEGVGLVTADELRLKQVLLNLLSNAVKFTPDGGSVVVGARVVGDDLEVTVADTGIGIAQEDQERIFDSFQQGTRAARNVEGTGLGLTLTRRIVELHGGRLWVESTPGLGSTFGFTVPRGTPSATVPERDGSSHRPHRRADPAEGAPGDTRPTAVIIEDDPSSAELISVHLGGAGLRTVAVASGTEGLQAVHDISPAVVVLDIRLPGMDGWDVLTEIKTDPDLAATPVVVVSVLPDHGRGIALGASDYLVKPVARDTLLDAVRRVLPLPIEHDRRKVAVMVDDDPIALELAALALEPQGWTLHTCQRAEDVFRLVAERRPSVVLVDLLMPAMDGFEVIARLRSREETSDLPVVVLTAKTLTEDDRRLLEGRIDFVTSKNAVDLRHLASRLAAVVARRGVEPGGAGHTGHPGHTGEAGTPSREPAAEP